MARGKKEDNKMLGKKVKRSGNKSGNGKNAKSNKEAKLGTEKVNGVKGPSKSN